MFRMKFFICLVCAAIAGLPAKEVTFRRDYVLNEIFGAPQAADDNAEPASGRVGAAASGNNDEIGFAYQKTFVDFYYEGVQAYLANDWETCVDLLERSLLLYRDYYDAVSLCRIHCEFERNRHEPLYHVDYEHRQFFEGAIVKTLCMERCRQDFITNLPKWFMFGTEEKTIFMSRKPYQYLQLCYYKDGELEKALMATYTALVVNTDDTMLRKNMEFYMGDKYSWTDLKDMEELDLSKHYLSGIALYKEERWSESIAELEIAVDLFVKEHDKCRAFCEGGFHQNWLPDFSSAISNHYVFGLRCKRNCTRIISHANGRFYDDLLPSMYDYLQYAYYKDGALKEASKCVSSFLLFYPQSEDMLANANYYKSLPDVIEDDFKPRREANIFYYRELYEIGLIDYVDKEFGKLVANSKSKEEDDFR